MKCNHAGKSIIKSFEGLRLQAYRCPAGIWTIGYGDTHNVTPGMVITEQEADERLDARLLEFEEAVSGMAPPFITENQFSALVSFAYNVGASALAGSTMLQKLNAGDIEGAAREFPRWNKSGGRVLNGLTRRRNAEKELFLTA